MNHQELEEFAYKWILKVVDQGGQPIRLDRREFINMGALFSDSKLSILVGCLELSIVNSRHCSSKLENSVLEWRCLHFLEER